MIDQSEKFVISVTYPLEKENLSDIFVRPYLERNGLRVYGNFVEIGWANDTDFGLFQDWKEIVKSAGLHESVIPAVEKWTPIRPKKVGES